MSANTPAAVMDLLQGRLGSLVGRPSGYIETLPKEVLQRVRGLKGVQTKHADLETKFHEEVLELEKKYADLYKPLYERRAEIVSGKAEPTEEEVEAGKKVEAQEAEEEGITVDEKAEEGKESERISIEKGIPEFWLTALKNHPQIADLITERDEEALRALTDIRMSYLEANPGFCLSFHFAANGTFTNSVLTKTYYYQSEAVGGDLVYDRAEGTKIDWKPDQDLSVTVQTKRQRHKGTNQTRLVKKTVPADTFFSFFSPPVNPSAPAEDDEDESAQEEDLDERLEADYELGEEFKEKVVPHAIDWFTGKALGYEDMDEDDYYHGEDHDEDDEEEDDDEDDEDDNDDDDENDDKAPAKDEKAPECKQQ